MSPFEPSRIAISSASDVGRVRRENEDACEAFTNDRGQHLLVVADGMGGHRGGATASRLAVDAIGVVFRASEDDPQTLLLAALQSANDTVYQMSQDEPELRGMGTTGVAVLVDCDGSGWVAHVGDSRAYRLRGTELVQLTEDHSVVSEMVRQGLLAPESAATHPRRNEILRSIGIDPSVEAELSPVDLAPGDRLVLCSDGLTGMLDDVDIVRIMQEEPPPLAAERLVEAANDRGGLDNVTVQIADIPAAQPRDARSDSAPTPGDGDSHTDSDTGSDAGPGTTTEARQRVRSGSAHRAARTAGRKLPWVWAAAALAAIAFAWSWLR